MPTNNSSMRYQCVSVRTQFQAFDCALVAL